MTDMPGTLRADTIADNHPSRRIRTDERRRNGGGRLRSLDGLSIEEAAVKLFELWKIGKEAKDNGLLLLWSTGDRRVRVEVGYGLGAACRWQGGGDSRYFA